MRRVTAVTSNTRGGAFRVPALRGDAPRVYRGSAALAPAFAPNSAAASAATGGSNNETMAVPPGVPAPA